MPATRALLPAAMLAALLFILALAGPAAAATRNGITPVAPKAGTSVPVGKSPVFRMRANGPGQVWVHVCKSKRKNADGVICMRGSGVGATFTGDSIGRAKKNRGAYEYKPRFFDFPEFWLNSPGTYYWQAHRITCNARDCRQEGPIVRFRVG
jgi:hypothetical protein